MSSLRWVRDSSVLKDLPVHARETVKRRRTRNCVTQGNRNDLSACRWFHDQGKAGIGFPNGLRLKKTLCSLLSRTHFFFPSFAFTAVLFPSTLPVGTVVSAAAHTTRSPYRRSRPITCAQARDGHPYPSSWETPSEIVIQI